MPKLYETVNDVFWMNTKPSEGDVCWIWQGTINFQGYGIAKFRHSNRLSGHRLSWELHNGPIPDGLCVCHKCDNRRCVNPNHLFLGTRAENTKDMYAKRRNRQSLGEKNGWSKLKSDQVRDIRALYMAGGTSYKKLARRYGVSHVHIGRIIRRDTWQHL